MVKCVLPIAIQMSTHNIHLYKEVDKKYTCCNLKTTELLDCALIGICAVIRSNTVFVFLSNRKNFVGTQKPVRISHGKRAIDVRAIEVRLYQSKVADLIF